MVLDGCIIRCTRDDDTAYGGSVRAFEITGLTGRIGEAGAAIEQALQLSESVFWGTWGVGEGR